MSRRTLAFRQSTHLVMRSLWAKGEYSFRRSHHLKTIERVLKTTAACFFVKVYRQSINSNHIHLIILAPNRKAYNGFIRVVTGLIATQVMGGMSFRDFIQLVAIKEDATSASGTTRQPTDSTVNAVATEPQGIGQKFWQFRPFTRVLHWGRDFRICCEYLEQNSLEAVGFVVYRARKDPYAKWIVESLEGTELVT